MTDFQTLTDQNYSENEWKRHLNDRKQTRRHHQDKHRTRKPVSVDACLRDAFVGQAINLGGGDRSACWTTNLKMSLFAPNF